MQQLQGFLCALLLLTGMACETVIEIDPPAYESELVVTSYFTPDSLWSTRIHRSLGIGVSQDPSAQYVENATVTILSGRDIVDTLHHTIRGRYESRTGRYPVAGQSYVLRAHTPGMTTVEAASTAPLPTPITVTSFENLGVDSPNAAVFPEYKFRLRFRIEDRPGQNFYSFGIYRYELNQDKDFFFRTSTCRIAYTAKYLWILEIPPGSVGSLTRTVELRARAGRAPARILL